MFFKIIGVYTVWAGLECFSEKKTRKRFGLKKKVCGCEGVFYLAWRAGLSVLCECLGTGEGSEPLCRFLPKGSGLTGTEVLFGVL